MPEKRLPIAAGADTLVMELESVSRDFDDGARRVRALDGVSLCIARGELLAIVGPSGSGKSTMLHLMGGLDTPTAGEIRVEGRALATLGDDALTVLRRRRIGFVFQFFNLLPTLTAEENVAVPLLLDGVASREVWRRARRMLGLVGIEGRRDHRPGALSGGEMQRVAIARALIIEPAIVLADEPTGNLDATTGHAILHLLRDLGRALGQTTVLVTHDPRAAASAGRVVTLVDGRVASDCRRDAPDSLPAVAGGP